MAAKITQQIFGDIFHDMKNGKTTSEICKKYKIGKTTFYEVKKSINYVDYRNNLKLRKLSEEQRELVQSGNSIDEAIAMTTKAEFKPTKIDVKSDEEISKFEVKKGKKQIYATSYTTDQEVADSLNRISKKEYSQEQTLKLANEMSEPYIPNAEELEGEMIMQKFINFLAISIVLIVMSIIGLILFGVYVWGKS